jgi:arsenate reductase
LARHVVLILCTGNSARSQMAEGLLRAKAGDSFEVLSAGTEPALRVNPLAVDAMKEIGLDISGARPKDMHEFLGRVPVRHLIIVCHDAAGRCPSGWPGVVTRVHWPIDDPAAFRGDPAVSIQKFRDARDEIASRLDGWLAQRKLEAR